MRVPALSIVSVGEAKTEGFGKVEAGAVVAEAAEAEAVEELDSPDSSTRFINGGIGFFVGVF